MDFLKTISIATSGMKAQSGRMRVIAENVANADSTGTTPGADPYRRKIPTFQRHYDRALDASLVELGRVARDTAGFKEKFEPSNPAANAAGNVKVPNVDTLIETMDMREAQRSYEANLNVITNTRRMITRTLDILRA
jgi:flagellar basal-body rod protein FlgC